MFGAVWMSAANAAVDSSTTTAVTGIFSDTKALIVGVLATGFFLVLLAVIAIRLGGKWGKKAANQ
jgi:hypothetical protein